MNPIKNVTASVALNMAKNKSLFWGKYSFLTQSKFLGWGEDNSPVWGEMIKYGGQVFPTWCDWNYVRTNFVAPLCNLASSVALFGNEWISDESEVKELKEFIDTHFCKDGRYLICKQSCDLLDAPLFWTGGGSRSFNLMQIFGFDIDCLSSVLDILRKHQQAGTMSLRSGGEWSRANTYAKSIVKNGGFSIIFYAHEAEVFYPIEYKEQVEEAGNEVATKWLEVVKTVKARMQSS